jgi:hypothetical protein
VRACRVGVSDQRAQKVVDLDQLIARVFFDDYYAKVRTSVSASVRDRFRALLQLQEVLKTTPADALVRA